MSNQPESDHIKDKSPPSYDDVVKILEPVLDVARCEHVTLNSLRTDKSLIPKLSEVGAPALLTSGKYNFLLVLPKTYCELESRRKALVQRCIDIEMGIKSEDGPFKPTVGRRGKMPDSRLRELARIAGAIHFAMRRLKENKWKVKIEKNKLSELHAERDALTEQLKNENIISDERPFDF